MLRWLSIMKSMQMSFRFQTLENVLQLILKVNPNNKIIQEEQMTQPGNNDQGCLEAISSLTIHASN